MMNLINNPLDQGNVSSDTNTSMNRARPTLTGQRCRIFREISAHTNPQGVKNLFMEIAEHVADK